MQDHYNANASQNHRERPAGSHGVKQRLLKFARHKEIRAWNRLIETRLRKGERFERYYTKKVNE